MAGLKERILECSPLPKGIVVHLLQRSLSEAARDLHYEATPGEKLLLWECVKSRESIKD